MKCIEVVATFMANRIIQIGIKVFVVLLLSLFLMHTCHKVIGDSSESTYELLSIKTHELQEEEPSESPLALIPCLFLFYFSTISYRLIKPDFFTKLTIVVYKTIRAPPY